MGDKAFPRQAGFPFSSHVCLTWEAHSGGPASPPSLLTRRFCTACDLPPGALVRSSTLASHSTAPAGGSSPSAPHRCYRCRIHRCFQVRTIRRPSVLQVCSSGSIENDHPLGYAHLTAHQRVFSQHSDDTARHGFFLRVFLQVPPSRPLEGARYCRTQYTLC
jgi:hypothetical protein